MSRRSISTRERVRLSDLQGSEAQSRLREILSYDASTGLFTWLRKETRKSLAGWPNQHGYIRIKVDGNTFMAHRLAWLWVTGEWPALQLDHINGNRSDNRIANLRLATRSQNAANRSLQSNNVAGFTGVGYHPSTGRWRARIGKAGKLISLGLFATPEEAAAARLAAAIELFGDFARRE